MISQQIKDKRQFWVILTIVFLGFLGISVPYLIFPALFLNPDFMIIPGDWSDTSRLLFLGITLAAYPLGQFFGSPILGSLSDDYGRKPLIVGSLIITALCNLLTGFSIAWQMLSLLIFSRFIAGLMEGNIAIARAMASDITTISKHTTLGKVNAAASIAYLIGPILGGLLTEKAFFQGLTTSSPFYFICVFLVALAGLSALILDKPGIIPSQDIRSMKERFNLPKRIGQLFTNQRLKFLLIVSTGFTLAVDIFYEFGPVFLTMKWDLSPSQLVVYNGLLCFALAAGNGWLAHYMSSRLPARTIIICAIAVFAISVMAMILTELPWIMMLLFTICGGVIGLAVTSITVKISNSVSDAIQGEVLGVQISLRVLGDALICLFGGALLLLSSKLILFIASCIACCTIVYYASNK